MKLKIVTSAVFALIMKNKIAASAIVLIAMCMFVNFNNYSTAMTSDQAVSANPINNVGIRALFNGMAAQGTVIKVYNSNQVLVFTDTTQRNGIATFHNVPAGVYSVFGKQGSHTGWLNNVIIAKGNANYYFEVNLNIEE
ncbi:MAG: hypothetical protein IPL53_20435 [Ignavibacteria bacterium]|nr:hypothetical protein [Ignavibacteria bacterium]